MAAQEPNVNSAETRGESLLRRILLGGRWNQRTQDATALLVVRFVFLATAVGLGLYGVHVIAAVSGRQDIEPLTGMLVGCVTGLVLILLEMFFSRSPIRILAAVTFGLIMGLVVSVVFRFVVGFIIEAVTPPEVQLRPEFHTLVSFLQLLTTTIFCYFGVTVLLQTKDDFKFIIPYVEFRKDVRSQVPLILDTSCFVDGRIFRLLETGLFDQRLVVPTFVLNELQTIADSSDRSLRERGRRGMDILHEVERRHSLEIADLPLRDGQTVDEALLAVGSQYGGKVVTTDYNLEKNGLLQGVPVLNINNIATALKPTFVPGETVTVRLLREGDAKGQAVGFLKDGTMVVVEDSRKYIGREVTAEVTSSLQTNAGKMIFGKLPRSTSGAGEA